MPVPEIDPDRFYSSFLAAQYLQTTEAEVIERIQRINPPEIHRDPGAHITNNAHRGLIAFAEHRGAGVPPRYFVSGYYLISEMRKST